MNGIKRKSNCLHRRTERHGGMARARRPATPGRGPALLAALLLAAAAASQAAAQNYRFQVEEMDLHVHVQPDASARLEYRIVFANDPAGSAIDVVDIGLPHRRYSIDNMTAFVDGEPLYVIRRSEYIDVGVEVHLAQWKIPPARRAEFRFACTMPDMVYQDTTDAALASLQIKPTWFDPGLQVGLTHLRVAVHLPPGIHPDEVKYHSERFPFTEKVLFGEGDDAHAVMLFDFPDHRLSADNPKLGVSFPQRVMDRVVKMSAWRLLVMWFEERPHVQGWSGILLCGAVMWLFLRVSGGTGWVLMLVILGGVLFAIIGRPGLHLALWPVVVGLIACNEWAIARRRRRYLPAMATVRGGGIKRGLTASQAAVVLELPLRRVLALVIFGLMKKGVLRQTAADPLTVAVDDAFRVPRGERRNAAAQRGIVLHAYEQSVIDLLLDWNKPVAQRDFSTALGELIRGTAERMKGFDLKATRDYYRSIVSRAWSEAEAIGDLDQRTQRVDRNFEWLLLDDGWNGRFDRWDRTGFPYRPVWVRSAASGLGEAARPATSAGRQVGLGEVAASFAGWAENTTGKLAAAIEPGRMGVTMPKSSFLDLSGVDRVTSDVFEALASSSGGGGGGGGGGGCACACAGCACACACAGGGR